MLPEVRNRTLAKIEKTTKAVDIRRSIIEFPEVQNALNKVELSIFTASTKDSIANVTTEALVTNLKLLTNYIKRDIGLTRELDEYDVTRFLDVLRKYYSDLSLSEVKLAFELSSVGELNDFLPKNADGTPRNGHYQQFNVEYYTKILTAYNNRKNKTVKKGT